MAAGPKWFNIIVFAAFQLGCAADRSAARPEQTSAGGAAPAVPAPVPYAGAGASRESQAAASGDGAATRVSVAAPPLDQRLVRARWWEQEPAALPEVAPTESLPPLPGPPPDPFADTAMPAGPDDGTPMAGSGATARPAAGGAAGAGATRDGGLAPSQVGNAVSGNPAAVNIVTGSGRLGELLGINRNGIRFGGISIVDANGNLAGGLGPGKWTGDTLTLADLSIDLEQFMGWKGALFGTEFLYFDSFGPGYTVSGVQQGRNNINALAGTVMGVNSLVGPPPLSRSELYELWFRQSFDDKLIFRIGKSVPTYDFNNVVRAVPLRDQQASIPAISSALFTPLYVNPTLLGVIPGYYNSATGLVVSYVPTPELYLEYGFFDGNLARGAQTGSDGPHFNGYWLHLLEAGGNWTIGAERKPGKFGAGAWFQTGKFRGFDNQPLEGANGIYLFASQRLYFESPGVNNNGLTSWYQFGATNSDIVLTHRYFGFGLTYFGLLPGREEDSCGFGLAYGVMTKDPMAGLFFFSHDNLRTTQLGATETILTWYYQIKMNDAFYVQPNLSYIPDPAQHPGIPGAFVFTMRAILVF